MVSLTPSLFSQLTISGIFGQSKSVEAFTKITSIFFLLFCTGCTTRAYPGPARPAEEVASIRFSSPLGTSIYGIVVDSTSQGSFHTSTEVIPGEHQIRLKFMTEGADCAGSDDFCELARFKGSCSGWIRTKEGRSYLVSVVQDQGRFLIEMLPKSYTDLFRRKDETDVGNGRCEIEGKSLSTRRNSNR